MLSTLKNALSHCTLLLDNPFYTIRTSTYLAYLRAIRRMAETESRPLANPKYRTFLLSRLLLYASLLLYMARLLIIARLQLGGGDLRLSEHAPFDPFICTLVLNFPSFNYLTLGAATLLLLFFILLDYYVSFCFDLHLATLLSNTVSNGDRFFTLNPRLQLPREIRFRQPKESYLQLRAWYKRMRNPLPRPTFVHSKRPVTYMSPRVRARLVLQCTLYEGAFACLNLIAGKIVISGKSPFLQDIRYKRMFSLPAI